MMETIGKVFARAEAAEARVKELEDFLEHEEHTYKYHENWWETRLERWKKKIAKGDDE
jgi:chaperonin cofactor prefoldin